ncbi:hypothetical protein HPB48_019277 [Haemaphysalis longicornis]|uniref:Sulfotransferase domain-containing protein n=1 Tax=Haemaphysalis longicornis TaxID=44386 RepID=A0A9J6H5A3_HAELO|nr:hypothetical protein HPB48_019277 [Haemaphysalis longicornis]
MKYKPRDGDIFVVTYPKCGTNWVHYIVYNILSRAKPPADIGEFSLMSPCIEVTGAEAPENPARWGPLMTHFPLNILQPVEAAKYIYVARNPYDCAVSYYHFIMGLTPKSVADVSFGKFLDMFLSGKVIFGDYFEHLKPWYERRSDSNVLFITYEKLKADTRAVVLRIAEFLGEEHGKALRGDDQLIERIVEACSVKSMKLFYDVNPEERSKRIIQAASKLLVGKEASMDMSLRLDGERHKGSGYVRKGIVGDWKNYFTPGQIKKTKAWITQKTRGSDIMKLWSDVDLS